MAFCPDTNCSLQELLYVIRLCIWQRLLAKIGGCSSSLNFPYPFLFSIPFPTAPKCSYRGSFGRNWIWSILTVKSGTQWERFFARVSTAMCWRAFYNLLFNGVITVAPRPRSGRHQGCHQCFFHVKNYPTPAKFNVVTFLRCSCAIC